MTAVAERPLEEAAARAFLLAWLARGFAYPREDRLVSLATSADDLGRVLAMLELEAEPEAAAILEGARGRLVELQGLYNRLFVTALEVPITETAYELDKTARRAAELADIQGFHRAFGLRVGAPVEPDHLVAELDFLSALMQKLAHLHERGDEEGLAVVEQAYRRFLEDHLGRWYEIFCERLEQATDEPYFRLMGRLLRGFLDAELRLLDLVPQRLTRYVSQPAAPSSWPCGAGPGARIPPS